VGSCLAGKTRQPAGAQVLPVVPDKRPAALGGGHQPFPVDGPDLVFADPREPGFVPGDDLVAQADLRVVCEEPDRTPAPAPAAQDRIELGLDLL